VTVPGFSLTRYHIIDKVLDAAAAAFPRSGEARRRLVTFSGKAFDQALDELLRWSVPVQRHWWRWVTHEHTTMVGFSNGDSPSSRSRCGKTRFIGLSGSRSNCFARPVTRHVTFGFGVHLCFGADPSASGVHDCAEGADGPPARHGISFAASGHPMEEQLGPARPPSSAQNPEGR
jgi:hypothetical protein